MTGKKTETDLGAGNEMDTSLKHKAIPKEIEEMAVELIKKFDDAWNTRNDKDLADLFHEEADFQFHYGHLVRGRERVQKYYRDKVFPYLPEGLRHVTRSYKVRILTDDVVIGDGRVDLVDESEEDPDKKVHKRFKVTTVVQKGDEGWRFSAVRVMVPVKD